MVGVSFGIQGRTSLVTMNQAFVGVLYWQEYYWKSSHNYKDYNNLHLI